MRRPRTSKKLETPRIWAVLALLLLQSVGEGCSTCSSGQKTGIHVSVFGVEVEKGIFYRGNPQKPTEVIPFSDPKVKDLVCTPIESWAQIQALCTSQ